MKKNLFTSAFIFILFALTAQAQNIGKGKWLAGGSLLYQSGSEFKFGEVDINLGGIGKINSFGFTPRVGYFVNDKIAVGARLSVAFANQGEGLVKASATGFGIAPFGRYYHALNDKLYVFGEALVNVGSISLKVDGVSENQTFSLVQFGINPGLAYFVHEKISLELMVNFFNYSSFKPKNGNADNNIAIGTALENIPTIGIFFYF
jgi:outer membrane protein